MYVIETIPGTGLDTLLTLYDAGGAALEDDDDGGPGVGSRIEYSNAEDRLLVIA